MNKKLIRKMLTASGGPLRLTPAELRYLEWSKMTPELQREYRTNRAKSHLLSGPNITNFWEAFQTYIGNRDPENPRLNTGIVNAPGMKNPKLIVQTATKIGRTLEDYLKATKVSAPILEGSTIARSSYATDRFIGGRLFLSTLPEEAMKILGHGMAKSPTILDALARLRYILDNGIKGKFYTAPLKVSKEVATAGGAIGTGEATPYFDGHFLITGKPGLIINSVDDIGTVYINDAYENEEALKAALKLLQYLLLTYPKINFKLYSLGFKQGGKMNILEFLKNGSGIHIKEKNKGKFTSYCGGKVTDECIRKAKASGNPTLVKRATFADNARHFKHKEGGKAFVSGVSILDSNPSAYKEVKKRLKKHLFGGDIILPNNYSNPNAFGGVFRDVMLGRLRDYELQQYKKKLKEQQLIVDAQLELLKNDTVSNLLGTAVNTGINYLSNKFGNKALDKNGTPSTIQPKLTTNTWKPNTSLFTPSLGTGTQGSIPDFSYMLNPSYKV